jgi:hypothetical protein
MAHNKSSPGIVTAPLLDSDVLWLDLVFHMDKLNWAIRRFDALTNENPASRVGQNPPLRRGGAFGLELIAAMCEAFEAACKELGDDTCQSEVPREVIARRIIAVAKLGDRVPVDDRRKENTNDVYHPLATELMRA